MRLSSFFKTAILLSLISWALAGCSTSPPRSEDQAAVTPQSAEVYLLRGLFDVFSLGMNTIGEQLQEQGVKAGVYSGPSWPQLAQQIVETRERGKKEEILVISGHSYGADDSIRLARALNDQGVAVAALVLVDPTTPPKVPGNVNLCINIYRSHPSTDWMPWLRGVPVEKENPATRVVNRDIRGSTADPGLADEVNHFSIEEHPAIQEMVLGEILNIIGKNRLDTAQARPASRNN